jgi:hypothetical protein
MNKEEKESIVLVSSLIEVLSRMSASGEKTGGINGYETIT